LISGPAAARTWALLLGLSNASGAGDLPISKAMAAAWRASTWTIDPAAARYCGLES
jgi:hypothetical protein